MTAPAPTADKIRERIATVEKLRAKWKGDPAYLATLDIDLFALRLAVQFAEAMAIPFW